MTLGTAGKVAFRPYEERDETAALALLARALGPGPSGSRSPEFFRWKHLQNPFGRSIMLVAEADDRLVGLRAFMSWSLCAGDRRLRAFRAVDTATDPAFQGRGIFSRLTREALDIMAAQGDLVFNTPNGASLPGYLKMGWQIAGRFPVAVRVRRPIPFAAGVRRLKAPLQPGRPRPTVTAAPAADVLATSLDITGLAPAGRSDLEGIQTPRTIEYLRWRYGTTPSLDYRAVAQTRRGRLQGLAIFRVRPRGPLWESTIAEVLVHPGDRLTAQRVVKDATTAVDVDHVTCSFLDEDAWRRLRMGFLPSPVGVTFVVRTLRPDISPDPSNMASWKFSLGDVEVF